MQRVAMFVVSVLVLGVGVCGAQDSEDDAPKVWVLVPATGDGERYTISPPGEQPPTVEPQWGGGYEIRTPMGARGNFLNFVVIV